MYAWAAVRASLCSRRLKLLLEVVLCRAPGRCVGSRRRFGPGTASGFGSVWGPGLCAVSDSGPGAVSGNCAVAGPGTAYRKTRNDPSTMRVCLTASVSQSMHSPLKSCFKMLVACHVRSNQYEIAQSMCYSEKQARLATVHPMHFCPYCLGSVLAQFSFVPKFGSSIEWNTS